MKRIVLPLCKNSVCMWKEFTCLIWSGLLTQEDLGCSQTAVQIFNAPISTRTMKQAIFNRHQCQAIAHSQSKRVCNQFCSMFFCIGHPVTNDKAVEVNRNADLSARQVVSCQDALVKHFMVMTPEHTHIYVTTHTSQIQLQILEVKCYTHDNKNIDNVTCWDGSSIKTSTLYYMYLWDLKPPHIIIYYLQDRELIFVSIKKKSNETWKVFPPVMPGKLRFAYRSNSKQISTTYWSGYTKHALLKLKGNNL